MPSINGKPDFNHRLKRQCHLVISYHLQAGRQGDCEFLALYAL